MARPRFRRKIEAAKAWLRVQLQDGKEHSSIELIKDGEDVGIARRTLQLASQELVQAGEMHRRMEYQPGRRWLWQKQEVIGAIGK